jgi:putative ABC transport system permease protein
MDFSPSPVLRPRLLHNIGLRYLLRHPWQSILMILGIALGVAVMVAIDLANASASRAFDLSTEAVAGRTTHQITSGSQGLDEALYTRLKLSGFGQSLAPVVAPVVADYATSPQMDGKLFTLLGVDPFAEAPFRSYLGAQGETPVADLSLFLTQPGAVLLGMRIADQYGLQACPAVPASQRPANCRLTLEIGGFEKDAFIAGLLDPADGLSQRALDNLILVDIATAQELTGRIGLLDRIDVILPEESHPGAGALREKLEAMLPRGASLQSVAARSGAVAEMTAAFRVNLTALSLLALLVGLFLIYNTITFSVVQRRALFGTLRCLGFTRQEVFLLVIAEAFLVGLAGTAIGLAAGVLMGQGALKLVSRTINDLFFVINVTGVQVPVESLLKGAAAGLAATLLTAAPPAWEAASVPPRAALYRSGLEDKAQRAVWRVAAAGILLALLGAAVLLLVPTRSLVVSFGGTFAVLIGLAMLTPFSTVLVLRAVLLFSRRLGGLLGRMGPRDALQSLSRTAVAIAALMVAVSVTIGVNLMIDSFRFTVETWLEQTLQGDVYISAPGVSATRSVTSIDPLVAIELRSIPEVSDVATLRAVSVDAPGGPVNLTAVDHPITDARLFVWAAGTPGQVWAAMQAGAVIVSEPYASRMGWKGAGHALILNTDQGARSFEVVGIFSDYASTQGTVRLELETYRRLWQDEQITAIALVAADGVDVDALTRQIQTKLGSRQQLNIRANQTLRAEALVVFDRTFAITGVMQLLATVVAFIGVLSALLAVQLDKQRQLGILRAVGMTARQVWGLVLIQTGLLGGTAGLLAMPTGYILALILVYIINLRSFGWTLQMRVTPQPFLLALVVAVSAALLAGVYPAYRMGRMMTVEALRGE